MNPLVSLICASTLITFGVAADCIREKSSRYTNHISYILVSSEEECWKKCQQSTTCYKATFDVKRLSHPDFNCYFGSFESVKTSDIQYTAFICKSKCTIESKMFMTTGSNDIVNPSCKSKCKCPLNGGASSCIPLCPANNVVCKRTIEQVNYTETFANSKCKCYHQTCLEPDLISFMKLEGESIKLFCLVPRKSWTFNKDTILTKSLKYLMGKTSLEMPNLHKINSGIYTCGDNKRYEINVISRNQTFMLKKDYKNGLSKTNIAVITGVCTAIIIIFVAATLFYFYKRRLQERKIPANNSLAKLNPEIVISNIPEVTKMNAMSKISNYIDQFDSVLQEQQTDSTVKPKEVLAREESSPYLSPIELKIQYNNNNSNNNNIDCVIDSDSDDDYVELP